MARRTRTTSRVISTRMATAEADAIERAAAEDAEAVTRNDWCRRVLAEAAADALEAAAGDEHNDAD